METRRLGRTGHESSIVTFGAYAAGVLEQADADRLIESALARGINQFDVAPSYADAELRLGDYLHRHPLPGVFISCKTQKRDRAGAREELLRTIERLGRDRLDLYQLHAVCTPADLDDCFAPGGSMEAFLEAYDEGLIANIGITGHGWQSPAVHLAALDRYPFATVMTSANLFMVQHEDYLRDWNALLARCGQDDIGIHVLKATARISWGDRPRTYGTWYEPFSEPRDVERAVAWALHQPVTTICSAGDVALLDAICDAADRYQEIDETSQLRLLASPAYGDIFVDA